MEIITMISRLTLRVEELTEKQELGNGLLLKLLKRQDRVLKHGTSPADAVAELPFSLPVESMEELHAVEAKLADDMALQEQLVSNHVFDILLHNDQICMGESFQSPDWIQSQQLKFSLPCLLSMIQIHFQSQFSHGPSLSLSPLWIWRHSLQSLSIIVPIWQFIIVIQNFI